MAKYKKPTVSYKTIYDEVAIRTGFPLSVIDKIIVNYYEIIKQCIESGVQVRDKAGTYTWTEKQPRENATIRNPRTNESKENVCLPGYWIPRFKPGNRWKESLKEKTRIEREESE